MEMISTAIQKMMQHKPRVLAQFPSDKRPSAEKLLFNLRCKALAASVFGIDGITENSYGCLAAMTLDLPKLCVHQIKPGAAKLMGETRLHSLPYECPKILQRPWILEVRDTEKEYLFGTTLALAGYWRNGRCYLFGITRNPRSVTSYTFLTANWAPAWKGCDIVSGTDQGEIELHDIETEAEYLTWVKEAARFSVVFALCLEAEGAEGPPFHVREESQPVGGKHAGPGKPATWSIHHVYVTEQPKRKLSSSQELEVVSAPGKAPREGMVLETVVVPTHLRFQAHGPKMSLRKWLWVKTHKRQQWVVDGPRRVVVH